MTETRGGGVPNGADVVWEAARLSLRGIDVGVDALQRAVDGEAEDLERAAIALDAIANVLPREDVGVLGAGDRVDEYVVDHMLGHGGMAAVYAAHRVDSIGQRVTGEAPVAIKVLPPWRAGQVSAVVRFRREAEATMRLEHPNIVKVHAMRESHDRIYYVMDLVGGGSLTDTLDRRPGDTRPGGDDLRTWLGRFAGLADGLAHAHEAGIVHRDIKPGNILVAEDDRLKLVDFGIARLSDAETMTATSVVLGTPLYMAPEQASGRPQLIGPKTDVYALGVSLFETLTGATPYRTRGTYGDVIDTIRNTRPLRARRLNAAIPEGLEIVLSRCLEKAPEDRPSAAELADALRRLAAGEPRPMRPLGMVRRISRGLRGPNALVAAGIVLMVALLLAVVIFFDPPEPDPDVTPTSVTIETQAPLVTWPSEEWGARVRPDGRISFISNVDFVERIWVTAQDEPPVPLTDPTPGAKLLDHVWSPDGERCAILRRVGNDVRLSVRTERTRREEPVAPLPGVTRLVRWIGDRVYVQSYDTVQVVDLGGGTVERLTAPDPKVGKRRYFDVRPDEGGLLFSAVRNGHEDLFVSALDGSDARPLTDTAFTETQPRWLDNDRVLFLSRETGQTVPAVLSVATGRSRTIPASCTTQKLEDAAPDFSAVVLRTDKSRAEIWSHDLVSGKRKRITADDRGDWFPSCGGGRIAFARPNPMSGNVPLYDAEIFVGRPARGTSDFRVKAEHALTPQVSPDGRSLTYMRLKARRFELWHTALDAGTHRRLSSDLLFTGMRGFPMRHTGRVRAIDGLGRVFFVEWIRDAQQERSRHAVRRYDPTTGTTDTVFTGAPGVWIRDLILSKDANDREAIAYARWNKKTSDVCVHQDGATRVLFTCKGTEKRSIRLPGAAGDELVVVRAGKHETQVLRVGRASGTVRTIATTTRGYGHTAVMAPDRGSVLMTMRDPETRVHNVWRVTLDGAWSRLTSNDVQGVTFACLATDASSRLYYTHESQNTNLWVVRPDQ